MGRNRPLAPLGLASVGLIVAVVSIASAQTGGGATPRCMGAPATDVFGAGDDFVRGNNNVGDVIVTGAGHDEIHSRGGGDLVCSGPGNDIVDGGRNADRLSAGAGRDEVLGGNGNDLVDGGPGADRGLANGATAPVSAGLFGGYRSNQGGSGDDRIRGGGGGDALVGQDGNDVLDGEGGRDRCSGGADEDKLRSCER